MPQFLDYIAGGARCQYVGVKGQQVVPFLEAASKSLRDSGNNIAIMVNDH